MINQIQFQIQKLINQMDKIDKNDYEKIKENLTQFVS